jgi:transposase-like protein
MRYPAAEKLEIIRLVETSPLPVRRTLAQIGIPKSTFYAWYERHLAGGIDALEDRKPRPRRVWNRIADAVREQVLELALDQPEVSPREVAITFTASMNWDGVSEMVQLWGGQFCLKGVMAAADARRAADKAAPASSCPITAAGS